MIFDYPPPRSQRRHGPRGYTRYEAYRAWLRDEFTFRCVYCLKRETWGQVTGEFDIDHFLPVVTHAHLATAYENLLYACRRCNVVKAARSIEDPFLSLVHDRLIVLADGQLIGRDPSVERLIVELDLNSPRLIEWRLTWLQIAQLAARSDSDLFRKIAGFPSVLPNLQKLRPPLGNSRPEGIAESWYSRAERGELPAQY